jgi:hypothetical protein
MSLVAAKDFTTTIHRFKAGAVIPDDAVLEPHTVESLKAGDFISDEAQFAHTEPRVAAEPEHSAQE